MAGRLQAMQKHPTCKLRQGPTAACAHALFELRMPAAACRHLFEQIKAHTGGACTAALVPPPTNVTEQRLPEAACQTLSQRLKCVEHAPPPQAYMNPRQPNHDSS